jgi:hypothetical protein
MHFLGRARPVDAGLGLLDLFGIGHALVGLRRETERAAFDGGEGAAHQIGADQHHLVMQFAGCHVGANRHFIDEADGAGVESLVHAHDHDAGARIAGHHRSLDGSGAAPARQQRAMKVEAATDRRFQHGTGKDEAVGDDHSKLGGVHGEGCLLLDGLQRTRGVDRDAETLCGEMDGRLALGLAAARGLGRARVDGGDLMAACHDLGERGHRKFGRAHEDDAHGHS